MRFVQLPFILILLAVCIMLGIESTFTFPVLSLLFLLTQQPLLSEAESAVVTVLCGAVVGVLYDFPLALGMAILLAITLINRRHWWQTHSQTRDGLLVFFGCLGIWIATGSPLELVFGSLFGIYYFLIIVVSRIWLHRSGKLLRHS